MTSLVNEMMAGSQQPTPVVGMGVTILLYSDRHAGTIVEVLSPSRIVVQEDNARRTDTNGMSESQTYEYTPNPQASRDIYTKRRNGRWVLLGEPMKGGKSLGLGYRQAYYDFTK